MDVYRFDLSQYIQLARHLGTDTESVEVKAAAGGLPKTFVETVSAFSNTSGGVIVLGLSEVDEFRPVKGFRARAIADAAAQACRESMEPAVYASVDIEEFENAPVVVAIVPELQPHRKPCFIKNRGLHNGSYFRMGDGDRRMTPYEADMICENRTQPHYDEEIVPAATMADFDDEMLKIYLTGQKKALPAGFQDASDEEILALRHLIAQDQEGTWRPTLAGLFSFGLLPQAYFPSGCVSFTVFPGRSKADIGLGNLRFVDSQTIEGSIPAMIAETMRCVRRNMRTSSVMRREWRVEQYEYPEEAVREAVANALIHRDYSDRGLAARVQVNMYDDRIEVMNPGGLYSEMTVERLGELGTSFPRNRTLARILEEVVYGPRSSETGRVVENKGSGFFLMNKAMNQAGLPAPVARDYISTFVVNLYKDSEGELAPWTTRPDSAPRETPQTRLLKKASRGGVDLVVGEATVQGVHGTAHVTFVVNDAVESDVIEFMEEAEAPVKSLDLMEKLGKSKATVTRALNRLMEKGQVERIGGAKGPGIRYRLRTQE